MFRFIFTLTLVVALTSCHSTDRQALNEKSVYSTVSQLEPGLSSFQFRDWAGPAVPVYVYIPTGVEVSSAPIMVMKHGAKRGAERYLKEWVPYAQEKGVIVVAPLFTTDDFPKAAGYNLGNVFKKEGKGLNKEEIWSFSAIEPIFDYVVSELNSSQKQYTLYGHSAGSQFVHRFLYYKPDARVKRFLAANAGWYTLPDMEESYPYGLKGAKVSQDALTQALQKDVVILLGDQDNDAAHKSLRRTEEAMRQGPHRFARGFAFHKSGEAQSAKLGISYGWRTVIVPNVAHSNGGIAAVAINEVE